VIRNALLALTLGFGCLLEAEAGSIEVAPILIQFSGAETTTTLTLTNRGEEPTTVQLRSYEWTQVDGEDVLTTTQDVVTSPPIFDLPVGQSQVVRILRRKPATTIERAYRIIADELPGPSSTSQLRFALRLSIPMFVDNEQTQVAPRLTFTLRQAESGQQVVGANLGTRRTKVVSASVMTTDGRKVELDAPATPYVLAGAERIWKVRTPTQARALRISAETEAGPLTDDVRF
jgi:fimbrial chaperone protein